MIIRGGEMFDPIALLFGTVSTAIVFFPAFLSPTPKESYRHYDTVAPRVASAPPKWLFAPAWMVLYALVATAEILHVLTVDAAGVDAVFVATWSLFVINVLLNHFWSRAFFDMRRPGLALADAGLLLLSAAAVAGLYGFARLWISMAFFIVYSAWLVYAVVINTNWVWVVNTSAPYAKAC